MDLKKFYDAPTRLAYHPSASLTQHRRGLKRFIAFDDRFVTVTENLEKLIQTMPFKNVKMLDIGIGDAVYESSLSPLARNKSEIYGVDISKSQLIRAKPFLKEGKVIDIDTQSLPFPNKYFDLIIISEILEHIFYPEKLLAEATRVLKTGGHLVITYPNSGSLQLRLALLFSGHSPLLNYPHNKEHIRFFNQSDILSMLPKSIKIDHFSGLSSFLFAPWNFLAKIPTPRLLQIFCNQFLPNLALGQLLILQA